MFTLEKTDDAISVTQTAAGNVVNRFAYPIDPDLFDETLTTILADPDRSHIDLPIPGAIFTATVLVDGIRFSLNEARRPQRLSSKFDWRDICRYLVTR